MIYDLIIIGGGSAGLFLAANSGKNKILLLEKMKSTGRKMLISGGGMCNLTNCDSTDDFLNCFGSKKKSNFLKPALMNFSTADTQKWFQKNGLKLAIREDGKVFPSTMKAQSVVDCLLGKARSQGVEFRKSEEVVRLSKDNQNFTVETSGGKQYRAVSVVIASGGKSFESTGSNGSGYKLARLMGHKIIEPTQGLVAVNIEDYPFSGLAGNSIRNSSVDFYRDAENKRYLATQGDLLFTHKGISGPVILNNSREIVKNDLIKFSLIPVGNKEDKRQELHKIFIKDTGKQVRTVLKAIGVFSALADSILALLEIHGHEKCSTLSKKNRNRLISMLVECPLKVSRKGYFSSAMVTAGGIDLNEIDRKTMESRLVKGLFFAGEVMDIDGNTGGYNIQAAFSTAYLVASALERRDN